MTQPSKQTKGAGSAGPAQGVASEAARSPQSGDSAATQADDAPDTSTCADCGSSEVIYVTDDPATEDKGYCELHVPANVTKKQIEEQGRG